MLKFHIKWGNMKDGLLIFEFYSCQKGYKDGEKKAEKKGKKAGICRLVSG